MTLAETDDEVLIEHLLDVVRYLGQERPLSTIGIHCLEAIDRIRELKAELARLTLAEMTRSAGVS